MQIPTRLTCVKPGNPRLLLQHPTRSTASPKLKLHQQQFSPILLLVPPCHCQSPMRVFPPPPSSSLSRLFACRPFNRRITICSFSASRKDKTSPSRDSQLRSSLSRHKPSRTDSDTALRPFKSPKTPSPTPYTTPKATLGIRPRHVQLPTSRHHLDLSTTALSPQAPADLRGRPTLYTSNHA